MWVESYLLGPKCATGAVLPKDYLTSSDSSYLPGFGPTAPASSKLSWVPLAVGAVLIGGVLYLVAKGATPVLANPNKFAYRRAARDEYDRVVDPAWIDFKADKISYAEYTRIKSEAEAEMRRKLKEGEEAEHKLKENPGLPDGVAKREGFTARDADPRELARGTKHEMEHTRSKRIARQIALDHLAEDAHYYRKLEKMERGAVKENASSLRVGDIVTFRDPHPDEVGQRFEVLELRDDRILVRTLDPYWRDKLIVPQSVYSVADLKKVRPT